MSEKCGCTGIRKCFLCNDSHIESSNTSKIQYHCFCSHCGLIFLGNIHKRFIEMCNSYDLCSVFTARSSIHVNGITVQKEFITLEEEKYLLSEMNKEEWRLSQSGRRKQDFGPKPNFKRKKVKIGKFSGLPSYSKFLVERMKEVTSLNEFIPVELCNLEYIPERGSSIDPHIDDIWLWGEQLVTINLSSATILTLCNKQTEFNGTLVEIQIPMPARSLVIIASEARYKWFHGIKANHISNRRIAMTFRNLSEEFDVSEIGRNIKEISNSFQGEITT